MNQMANLPDMKTTKKHARVHLGFGDLFGEGAWPLPKRFDFPDGSTLRRFARKTPRDGGTTDCVDCGTAISQGALCASCWAKCAFPSSLNVEMSHGAREDGAKHNPKP